MNKIKQEQIKKFTTIKKLSEIWLLYQNRYKLQERVCADFVVSGFVVSGFVINAFACPYGSYCINKITVGNLIQLWNNGFVYNNLPLIHYHQAYGNNSIHIAYINNGKLVNQTFAYNDEQKYIPNENVKEILKNLR